MGWRFRFYGDTVLVYWIGSITGDWIFCSAKSLSDFIDTELFMLAVIRK